jgi:hypothetical protein
LEQQLRLLVEQYPYIVDINAEFEKSFYERLDRCIAMFEKAVETMDHPNADIASAGRFIAKFTEIPQLFPIARVFNRST